MNIEFTLDKVVFEGKENFKICRVFPINDVTNIKMSSYDNISIKGVMIDLQSGIEYECVSTKEESSAYGTTYTVTGVKPIGMGDIDTDEEMLVFVNAMISKSVGSKLKNIEGICNIIKSGDIATLRKIKGIGKKTANKIVDIWKTEGVNSKYISELSLLGFNDKDVDNLSDRYNELSIALNIAKSNPYQFILDGVGIKLSKIDEIASNKLGIGKTDMRRIRAYIFKALLDESSKSFKSYISLNELKNSKTIRSVIVSIGEVKYTEALSSLVKDNVFKKLGDNIGLYSIYNRELELKNEIDRISSCNVGELGFDIDREIDKEESLMGFKLTNKQRNAIRECLCNNFTLVKGHAGTGKTTITRITLNILERHMGSFDIKQCALSGKAAQVLSKATSRESMTIHRLLRLGTEYEHNSNNYIDANVIVIDELSMVDISLFKKLLEATDVNTRVICMGDNNQLPSLAYGKMITDLELFDKVKVVELTEVHRQALESGIILVANDLRNGGLFTDPDIDELTLGNHKDMNINTCENSIQLGADKVLELYDSNNKDKVQAVCATSSLCYRVNKYIQSKIMDLDKSFIVAKAYGNIPKVNDDVAKYRMFEGDKIMIIKNMYDIDTKEEFENYANEEDIPYKSDDEKHNLYNGNIGSLVEIRPRHVVIEVDGVEYIIEDNEYDNIQLAYACTCHKLQGSSSEDVVIIMEGNYVEDWMICNEWLYTAVTRAKERCYMYGVKSKIDKGVKIRNVNKKTTFLELMVNK